MLALDLGCFWQELNFEANLRKVKVSLEKSSKLSEDSEQVTQ